VKRSKGDSAAASLYLAAIDLILLAFPQPEKEADDELDSADLAV
jgi:hypothetical protein